MARSNLLIAALWHIGYSTRVHFGAFVPIRPASLSLVPSKRSGSLDIFGALMRVGSLTTFGALTRVGSLNHLGALHLWLVQGIVVRSPTLTRSRVLAPSAKVTRLPTMALSGVVAHSPHMVRLRAFGSLRCLGTLPDRRFALAAWCCLGCRLASRPWHSRHASARSRSVARGTSLAPSG